MVISSEFALGDVAADHQNAAKAAGAPFLLLKNLVRISNF